MFSFDQCCCGELPGLVMTLDPQAEEPQREPCVGEFRNQTEESRRELGKKLSNVFEVKSVPWHEESPNYKEFRVTVEKCGDRVLGLELDLLDGLHAMVCDVRPGLVQDYNAEASPETQVRSRDWIVEVNGVQNNAHDMHKRLRNDSKISMRIRRTQPSRLRLGPDQAHGLSECLKSASAGISCLVVEDRDDELKKNDRIVEVNGIIRCTALMMDEIQNASDLQLSVMNPAGYRPIASI
jgi:hypothetical protein